MGGRDNRRARTGARVGSVLLILTLALAITAALTALAQPRGAPNVEELVFPVPDLGGMRYTISLPEGPEGPEGDEPGEARPLVLALHPGGAQTPYYGGAFLRQVVEPALRDWDAIIVAPDCPTRAWTSTTAESAVLALLDDVLANYAVDRDRVLVTGFSLGGRGTWFMATHHPDVFTGAIAIAGSPSDDPLDALGDMPVSIIHSRDDEVVAIGPAREAANTLKDRQHPVLFTELRGIGHFQMGGYIDALRQAGEWMMEQWER